MAFVVSESDEIDLDRRGKCAGPASPVCKVPRAPEPEPAPAALDEDQAALRFAAANRAALCTIVGIDGSFSRRLGAQLAIGEGNGDGVIVGSLADGCLEHELVKQARDAAGDGMPRLLRYGRGSPFVDFRFPCGSGIDVMIEPAPDRTALAQIVASLDGRAAASLPLAVERDHFVRERHFIPALRLLILGAGPEAVELRQLATNFGCTAVAAGPDDGLSLGRIPLGLEVDPWTAIVLLFHDHEWEGALLDWALGTSSFYIGSLGGRRSRLNRVEALVREGHSAAQIARIRAPIGLIPRTRDARTLALSVLAEVVAEYEKLRR